MFACEPMLSQYIDVDKSKPEITQQMRNAIGDIRQPWIDVGNRCGMSGFEAKALFAIGMMRRYILSANAVLQIMNYRGFASAYGLLSSGVELLGRCTHPSKKVRQHPVSCSMERLAQGFDRIKLRHLPPGIIVATNHHQYTTRDLENLRNLVIHGACIAEAPLIKGDIELLEELRRAFYGVPIGKNDPLKGAGPIEGELDRYYGVLSSGDKEMCERLATAAISPAPLQMQDGNWPFDAQMVNEIKLHIQENLKQNRPPVSGGHTKTNDHFQLY